MQASHSQRHPSQCLGMCALLFWSSCRWLLGLCRCCFFVATFEGLSTLHHNPMQIWSWDLMQSFNLNLMHIIASTHAQQLYIAEIIKITTPIKVMRNSLEDHLSVVLRWSILLFDVIFLLSWSCEGRTSYRGGGEEERAEGETVSTKVASTQAPEV